MDTDATQRLVQFETDLFPQSMRWHKMNENVTFVFGTRDGISFRRVNDEVAVVFVSSEPHDAEPKCEQTRTVSVTGTWRQSHKFRQGAC